MPALADWQVDSLRLTVFTTELTASDWGVLWPANPDVVLTERREQPSLRSSTLVGMYERWQVTVQSQLDRVDVLVSAPPPAGPIIEFPSAGSFDEVVPVLRSILPASFGKRISRAAFGAVLLCPADDHRSAYQKLGEYLPHVQVDPECRDFFYQINRPLAPSATFPEVNRLSQWVAIRSGWINPAEPAAPTIEIYASRLVLDINTSPSVSLSVRDSLPGDLFDLLVSEARNVASGGNL